MKSSLAPPPRPGAAALTAAPRRRATVFAVAAVAACVFLLAARARGGAPGVPVALNRLRAGLSAAPEAVAAAPAARPDGLTPHTPVALPQPLLTELELLTLMHHVRGARQYVEWGSGASTTLVAPLAARALSIENGATWCAELKKRADVRFWEANGGLKVVCVDTGPTGAFGVPAAGADPDTFPRYSGALAAELGADAKVDAVLVDGRFRVACALAALRHVRACVGVVMIHDWERTAYHAPVLEFYDVVEIAERLAVLTPKAALDRGRVAAALRAHERSPG